LSPPRGWLIPWNYFLSVYAVLVAGSAAAIFFWETRRPQRRGQAAAIEGMRSSYFRSQWRGGWLSASPWILGFIIFTGGPILFSIVISFGLRHPESGALRRLQ
jgi:ABC-type Fe3+ transport system permease subunit